MVCIARSYLRDGAERNPTPPPKKRGRKERKAALSTILSGILQEVTVPAGPLAMEPASRADDMPVLVTLEPFALAAPVWSGVGPWERFVSLRLHVLASSLADVPNLHQWVYRWMPGDQVSPAEPKKSACLSESPAGCSARQSGPLGSAGS